MKYIIEYTFLNTDGTLGGDRAILDNFASALNYWGNWYANLIVRSDIPGFCLGIFCTDGSQPAERSWKYFECPNYVNE